MQVEDIMHEGFCTSVKSMREEMRELRVRVITFVRIRTILK